MKSANMIKIVSMILMGFALSVQGQGDFRITKSSHTSNQPIVYSYDYPVVRSTARIIEIVPSNQLEMDQIVEIENWMFSPAYLLNEESTPVESWMLQSEFLSGEVAVVENWMMEEDYLDAESVLQVEGWMKDPNYLKKM